MWFKTSEVICQQWALEKATSLKRPFPTTIGPIQRSDSTSKSSITQYITATPSQSEIFSDHTITENISKNISPSRTTTSSQREILSETQTASWSTVIETCLSKPQLQQGGNPAKMRQAVSHHLSGPTHPPKVNFFFWILAIPAYLPKCHSFKHRLWCQ